MKTLQLLILLSAASLTLAHAQVGRHELPHDTISIGGEQQETKEMRMEGKEQVARDLVALRDSINTHLSSMNDNAANVLDAKKQQYQAATRDLTKYKDQLDEMIGAVTKGNWDDKLSERSYATLNEVREGFNKIRKDLK